MYKSTRVLFSAFFLLFAISMTTSPTGFKTQQKKHIRVKNAYTEKEAALKRELKTKKIDFLNFELLLVGYKYEKELCIYVKNKSAAKYELLKTVDFCVLSGELGPKRKQGDNQVPEGLYTISNFNPVSNYHLSLKINYPNKADDVLSDKNNPGGDIYIHGSCVSIGCIPITDEYIKELYVLAVETKNHGYDIPVYIFPFKMTDENVKKHAAVNNAVKTLWDELKAVYDEFAQNQCKIAYKINKKGQYVLNK